MSPTSSASVPSARAEGNHLTRREVEVLRLLADGLSSKEVAARLSISFKTAASHRSNILTKLGLHETVLAVRWAIRNGLLEP